jgi:hypothetical protein
MDITFDQLFSYWLVAWFLLFYAVHKDGKKDKIPSPKFGFILAIITNIFEITSLFKINIGLGQLIKYGVTIALFKILPLYLLWDIPLKLPRDIFIFIFAFFIYFIYLHAIGTSLAEIYKETNKSLETNGGHTPFYRFVDWISSKINYK